MTSPINIFLRVNNLVESILEFHKYCTDNSYGDGTNGTYSPEDFGDKNWDGLDLDEIEINICKGVAAIDLLRNSESRAVIHHIIAGSPDPE